ncbi:MAG: M56 family metallopeptidase [Bacteroidota bacterium]
MSFIDPKIAEAVGLALLHSYWQAGLLALIIWWASRRPELSPKSRYRLAYGALLVLLIISICTSAGRFIGSATEVAATAPAIDHSVLVMGSEEAIAAPTTGVIAPVIAESESSTISIIFYRLWLLGLVLGSLHLLIGQLYIDFRYRRQLQPLPLHWQKIAKDLSQKLNLQRLPKLALSGRIVSPALLGHLRPLVLLPICMVNQLSPAQAEAVLAHELAHFARRDHWWNLLQSVIVVLFFLNPFVHWISSRIREEREHCCDRTVTRLGIDPLVYAKTLLHLEQQDRRMRSLSLAAKPGSLASRIGLLLQGTQNHYRMKPVFFIALLVSLGLLFSARSPEQTPPVSFTLDIQGEETRMNFRTELEGETFSGTYLPERDEFEFLTTENGSESLQHLPELIELLEAELEELDLPLNIPNIEIPDRLSPRNDPFPDGLVIVCHSASWRNQAMESSLGMSEIDQIYVKQHEDSDRPQYLILDGELKALWLDGREIDLDSATKQEKARYLEAVIRDFVNMEETPVPPPPPPAPPAAPGVAPPPPPVPPNPPSPPRGITLLGGDDENRSEIIIRRIDENGQERYIVRQIQEGEILMEADSFYYDSEIGETIAIPLPGTIFRSINGFGAIDSDDLKDLKINLEELQDLEDRLADIELLNEEELESTMKIVEERMKGLKMDLNNVELFDSEALAELSESLEKVKILRMDSISGDLSESILEWSGSMEGLDLLADHPIFIQEDDDISIIRRSSSRSIGHNVMMYRRIVEEMQTEGVIPGSDLRKLTIKKDIIKVNGRRLKPAEMAIFQQKFEDYTGHPWEDLRTYESEFQYREN